jgi:hypothetical protein
MTGFELLMSDPTVLVCLLAVGVGLVASGLSGSRHRTSRQRYHTARTPSRRAAPRPMIVPGGTLASDPSHAAGQLQAVMLSSYSAKPVLSRTELKVLLAAERAIAELQLPWRVMAQVALGEVLESPDIEGFHAINAKRVDLLVVTEQARPVAAIEYQGQGHYQGTAPARDAIKKEALRRAGIGYVEITFRDGPGDVRREIARLASANVNSAEFRRLVASQPVKRRPIQESAEQAA